ncbi:MAG: H-X9-DG-CTERM domain-containing protein, partial [Parcubacteria group bacterium]
DAQTGPLARYLGSDRMIRACQPPGGFRDNAADAFEASCGGYGYNDRGVGSQAYLYGFNRQGVEKGMKPGNIQNPAQTVMFCDTAFPQPYDQPEYLIEYSFAEAYRFIAEDSPTESGQAMPSIHFRHLGKANVVWCDGHVSAESMTKEYNPDFTKFNIGWFGGPNNDLFDPF